MLQEFTGKFVVYQINASGVPELTWTEEDELMVFDTYPEAALELADHIKSTAEAEMRGDMQECSTEDEMKNNFIAFCDLEGGEIRVYDVDEYGNEEEIIYATYESIIKDLI